MNRAYKYLVSFIIPLVYFVGFYEKGFFTFGAILVAFVAIPLLEFGSHGSTENLDEQSSEKIAGAFIYDLLLYLHLPVLLFSVYLYFFAINSGQFQSIEVVGMTLSIGVYLGGIGINIAHELGHRNALFERVLAQIFLLPNLYMHFSIEHNRGHHLHIATDNDPASSRYNESVYAFWFRSVCYGYLNAWKLESKRLKMENKSFLYNQMLWISLIELFYLGILFFIGSWYFVMQALIIAMIGFLLLETVNYIEHYGLRRKKLETGSFERVQPWHSWNSNHNIGRLFLFELSRHSDHHYKASRKYQVLRHFEQSPQLPYGYPSSMLLALIPPLWFSIMNPLVKKEEEKQLNGFYKP